MTTCLKLAVLLFPVAVVAQQPNQNSSLPYDAKLIKQEPEMGMGEASFKVSPRLRGMRGLNGVVLWVSADQKSLSAYKGNQLLWKTNVAAACSRCPVTHRISTVVSESPVAVIFVFTDKLMHAEIDRKTGRMSAIGVDPN